MLPGSTLPPSTTPGVPNRMAHVWARYLFHYKGAPNHCGYESYGLFHDRWTWKIVSFADNDNVLKGRSLDEVYPED